LAIGIEVNVTEMTQRSVTWQLAAGARFDKRVWDDEVVLFNLSSDQTHLLDAFSAQVLSCFEEQPWRVEDLATHLEQALSLPAGGSNITERLQKLVDEFASLGLLDRGSA
jgi:PqqD family protein of HPr-rel-A system